MSFWKKKDNLIITAFVLLFFVGLYGYDRCCVRAALPNSSSSALHVPFTDQNQGEVTLESFRGKPLIVNFWATWCPVCVQKMGTLNSFAEKFKARGGQVVSVSEDQGGLGTVKAYFARNNYQNLDIYLDLGGELMHSFKVTGLPTSIFIDANGNELGRISGGIDWSSPAVLQMVNGYFNIAVAP